MTKKRIYGQWAGNEKGTAENPARCIKEVHPQRYHDGWIPYQCKRKRGYGPSGLYCKQHGTRAARTLKQRRKR